MQAVAPLEGAPAPPQPGEVVAIVHIAGDTGFVWDAVAARRLRQSCRLVGAMVGALAGFRQQDAVHGLPLQLNADEVTLAAERGWVVLAQLEPPEPPADQAGSSLTIVRAADCSSAPKGKRHRPAPVSWNSMAQRKSTVSALESAALIRGRTCSNAEMEEQPWKRLSSADGKLVIALTTSGRAGTAVQPAVWDYPRTEAETVRYRVFADLHARGYTMTSGAKFGGDYLAYPGDPLLYHAQYTVRCLRGSTAVHPLALSAAARMAHAARKHVVLASVLPPAEGEPAGATRVEYLTLSPDIQQSTNRERPARNFAR